MPEPTIAARRGADAFAQPSPCRFCGAPLSEGVADLGLVPLAAELVAPGAAAGAERFYPLRAMVCSDCRLVQLAEPDIFPPELHDAPHRPPCGGEEAAERQAWAERMIRTLRLGPHTPVVEIGATDGVLRDVLRRSGVPVTAVDGAPPGSPGAERRPAVAFGATSARRLRALGPPPALLVANDLPARTADLHGLVEGVRHLLAPGGVAAFELRHLLRLMQGGAFGAFRHGRWVYPSLLVAELILGQHGLVVFDAEELPAEGGTLRLLARHVEDTAKPVTGAVERLRAEERRAGLEDAAAYARFARTVVETKCALLDFLLGARRGGRRVMAYGATPEGVTLLNYCGAGPELVSCVIDPDPARQGMLLPGLRLPVRAPAVLLEDRPDYLLVLPGSRAEAVMEAMAVLREGGGRFVLVTPRLRVL